MQLISVGSCYYSSLGVGFFSPDQDHLDNDNYISPLQYFGSYSKGVKVNFPIDMRQNIGVSLNNRFLLGDQTLIAQDPNSGSEDSLLAMLSREYSDDIDLNNFNEIEIPSATKIIAVNSAPSNSIGILAIFPSRVILSGEVEGFIRKDETYYRFTLKRDSWAGLKMIIDDEAYVPRAFSNFDFKTIISYWDNDAFWSELKKYKQSLRDQRLQQQSNQAQSFLNQGRRY
ncbi:MAG: hypothetical protein ACRCXZ_08420 [Patescibacteria group bacterium]